MYESHEYYLRRAIDVSKQSRAAGNTPFGALLVSTDPYTGQSAALISYMPED